MCCVSAFDKVEHWKELQSLVSNNILLSTDVLVFLRDAGHLPNADSILDVFELQTQVLTRDGQHGSSLPRACLWKQLDGRTNYDIIHVIQNVTINIYPKVHPKNCVCVCVCSMSATVRVYLWSVHILKESDTCNIIKGDEKWPWIH